MIKRIFLFSLGAVAFLAATLLLWQPERLQRKVVDYVLARIEQTTPCIVQVTRISGNFFTRFTLHDVRVRPQGGFCGTWRI